LQKREGGLARRRVGLFKSAHESFNASLRKLHLLGMPYDGRKEVKKAIKKKSKKRIVPLTKDPRRAAAIPCTRLSAAVIDRQS